MERLDRAEAIRRLRAIGQPATLFGEDDDARLARLRDAQSSVSVADEHAGGQQANERQKELRALEEYARKQREKASSARELAERRAAAAAAAAGDAGPSRANSEETPSDADPATAALEEAFKSAAAAVAKQRAAEALEPVDQVAAYFRSLLDEWDRELGERPERWIHTEEGRQSVANARLCRAHMKPLFKRIKRRELPGDIERALFLVVRAMKARDYRKAADVYVGVAIGNAAWPIGVTMVGIHERSAREKIGAQTQAHAMHDEETRKYLQSVKRLITFAQRRYPTTPSLSLDFNSGFNGWDKEALAAADARVDIRAQVPALLALPQGADGRRADGWKAQESDTRTWKSLLTHAYDGEKADFDTITTAKDAVLARDKTMYDDKSGHLTKKQR